MEEENSYFSTDDFDTNTLVNIKPLNHKNFEYISLGEKYILWQRFISYYHEINTINLGAVSYKVAYFLADDVSEKFYQQKTKHKVLLDYFYSMLNSILKCADVIVTNQLYIAIIADSLGKSVFWIKDNFAKKQKFATEVLSANPRIQQLPINFDITKNITEFLRNQRPQSNIQETELLNANPFPLVDVPLEVQVAPKPNKNTVRLVFTTDENYAVMTAVAIQSAVEHKSEKSFYDITIVGHQLSNFTRWAFAMLERLNVRIKIINVDDLDKFKDIKKTRHINQTALLIFDLPEILSDLDKVLYLDGDIFVQGDLQDFYNTDVSNNYAAVVRSAALIRPEKHRAQSKCSNDNYFNGGVILMNLKKMRQDNVSKKMLDWKKENEGFFMNQDALNMILSPNVKQMSCWHNFLAYYPLSYSNQELRKFYNVKIPKDIIKTYKKALILHYPGKVKPYKENMGYLTEEFMRYLSHTEFKLN